MSDDKAEGPTRPGPAAPKKDSGKKLAALRKKQLKLLKAKDPGKKREGLVVCVQSPAFFREQPEVLPTLLALLTRLKAADIVLETLTTFEALLSTVVAGEHSQDVSISESVDSETRAREAEVNALYMIQSSKASDAGYEGGQPFVALFTANAASTEIKTKAIIIFNRLLEFVVSKRSTEPDEVSPQMLLSYQTAGGPTAALLTCLESGETSNQFAALSCLAQLLESDRDHKLLAEFTRIGGYAHVLQLGQHSERRFHSVVLEILGTLSRSAAGREQMKAHGALEVLDQMLKETFGALTAAASAIAASGPAASAITAQDASRMGSDIPLMCQVFVRVQFGNCLPEQDSQNASTLSTELSPACLSFIESMLSVLKKDIGGAIALLGANTTSSPPPTTGNVATVAAAAVAATNVLAATALFPFRVERVVTMLSTLGRMIERSDQCSNHAFSNQVVAVALDCFKLPDQPMLHQVADKLLHQSCIDGDCQANSIPRTPRTPQTPRSPNTPRSLPIKTLFQPIAVSVAGEANEQSGGVDAGVSVEAIGSLLESLYEASDHASIFRLVRWLSLVVSAPENARSLGDRCPTVLLKILARCSIRQHLLVGFISKTIESTVEANPNALESCGYEGADPVPKLVAYLQQAAVGELDEEDPQHAGSDQTEGEIDVSSLLLEWIDEQGDSDMFEPMELTDDRHSIDPFVNVSQALFAILQAFQAAEGPTSNFWDLFTRREGTSGGQQSKPSPAIGSGATAPSKKRLDTPSAGAIGESCALSLLCSSQTLLSLVPIFAGESPVVCVALLSLISKLLVLCGGSRVLLHLVLSQMEHTAASCIDDNGESGNSPSDVNQILSWPIDTNNSAKTAHSALLQPILAVLHSFTTCFDEVEAAVSVLAILTDQSVGKDDECSAQEVDRFVNCVVASGGLVVLVSYLDGVRIPKTPLRASSGTDKLELSTAQVKSLVLRFTNWGREKQQASGNRDGEEQTSIPVGAGESTSTLSEGTTEPSSFGALWATQLLDLRFDVPRFGYSNYTALLLASEIGQTDIAIALLNAGASATAPSAAGATPLMLAVLNRNEALASELLRHGANVDAITTDGRDQTVWLCALVSSSDANALISDTYVAASDSIDDPTVDALPLLMGLDTIRGSPVALHDFMQQQMDVNISDANGNFLLHAALSKAHVRQKLRGIDLCFRYDSRLISSETLTALITALIEEHGADVHKANRLGQTPLHMALLYGHSDTVRLLLHHGANPNVLDVHGYLPLHYASCGFCVAADGSDGVVVELVQLLLEASERFPIYAGVHVDDRKFKTQSEKRGLEIEEVLRAELLSITQPSSITTKLASRDEIVSAASTIDGFLPWHMTCGAFAHSPATLPLDDVMTERFTSNGSARCAILRYFVDVCGVGTAKPAYKGVTALHLAIKSASSSCNDDVIEMLLAECVAAGKPNRLDINAVHDAATVDCLPALAIGSEVTVVGVDPPEIHGFVSSRSATNPSEYHVLLSNGVHVESVDRQRLRLTDSSAASNTASKRYYLFIESSFTALHYALQTSDALSRRLLAIPEITQDVDSIDIPFLALACAAHRSADVIKALIGPSANVRVKLPLLSLSVNFRTGSSSSAGSHKKHAAALHYAVMYEDAAVVRELVASDCVNVNVRRSGDGFTPLHLACEMNNVEIIKLLLEHDADVGQKSSASHQDSVTPLELLVKNGAFTDAAVHSLVLDKCHDLRLLFGDFVDLIDDSKPTSMPDGSAFNEEENNGTGEASCFLLNMEIQSLHLFERIQQLRAQRRAPSDLLARKLEIDLSKLDRVLMSLFELVRNHEHQNCDAKLGRMDAALLFASLPHPHECFQSFITRSAWIEAPEAEALTKMAAMP